MNDRLDILLLLALPASGKSEVRKFLKTFSPEECVREFHLGPTVQLDDFPYVHLMRRVDEELAKMGRDGVYFQAQDRPFRDAGDWGTLIALLNEDFEDLLAGRTASPASAAALLFERLDRAAARAGARPKMGGLPGEVREALARRLEDEARAQWSERVAEVPETLQGKTILFEFARGGPDGAAMPLPPPLGYAHSLRLLDPRILERACILYVWVTPEESRRKNQERADPNDPGSILHHGVPIAVMLGDYGCDDLAWLLETSDRPGTVRIEAHGRVFHLPAARLDNRVDRTTFVRKPRDQWQPGQVAALRDALKAALDELYARSKRGGRDSNPRPPA